MNKIKKFEEREKLRLEAIERLPKNMEYMKDYYKPLPEEIKQKVLDEPDRVVFDHKGYRCAILRVETAGHLCGYVKIDSSSKLYKMDYGDIHKKYDINVHGGLTFSDPLSYKGLNDFYIGFDCRHMIDLAPFSIDFGPGSIYRGIEYVENQIKQLVDQIIHIDRLGFCRECGTEISFEQKDKEHENVYHCSYCGHPHAKKEMWEVLPDYLIEYRKENNL